MNDVIVLYPFPLMGHLISLVELGKLILKHHPSFSIIIVVPFMPHGTAALSTYMSDVSATSPSISFRLLPPVLSLSSNSSAKVEDLLFEIPRLNNPNLRQALEEISNESRLKAFIIDFFCNAAFEVSTSTEMRIPTYYYNAGGALSLCIFLYLPTLHSIITKDIKDLNTEIQVPCTPPVHSRDFPELLSKRESESYKNFLSIAINMGKSSGIITNTFEALEPRAVKGLSDGLCTPNAPAPPVYCIGPLISSEKAGGDHHECLSWLNLQPSKSVVFLCFGSRGLLKAEQLKEMAIGLENSAQRFLWVVRDPPTEDDQTKSQTDMDAFFPEGFLDRTKDRGLVMKSWAPQMEVLNHDAVGGFVTHCGWNSVLEAVLAGVPMVAWPLYAEQKMNRVFLVEEMKVALAVDQTENGFVMAAELENRIRELMDSECGKATRDQVMAMRDAALAAVQEGGSSHITLAELIQSLM